MARTFFMDDKLPRDLLEAIGEVAVAEAQLDAIVINALKRAYGITASEANSRAKSKWRHFDKQRAALVEKFGLDFPGDHAGLKELESLMNEAEVAREARHTQVHAVAVVDAETGQPLRLHRSVHIGHDVPDLNALRENLRRVRNAIETFTRRHYLEKVSA